MCELNTSLKILCFQVHILDLKRQLETETNRHINTKELLKNAQKETTVLKQQLNNTEAQLASQSSQRALGKGRVFSYIEFPTFNFYVKRCSLQNDKNCRLE